MTWVHPVVSFPHNCPEKSSVILYTLIAVQRHYFKADIKKTVNLGIVQFCYVGSIVGLVSTLQGVQIHLKGAYEFTIMFMVFAEVTMSLDYDL